MRLGHQQCKSFRFHRATRTRCAPKARSGEKLPGLIRETNTRSHITAPSSTNAPQEEGRRRRPLRSCRARRRCVCRHHRHRRRHHHHLLGHAKVSAGHGVETARFVTPPPQPGPPMSVAHLPQPPGRVWIANDVVEILYKTTTSMTTTTTKTKTTTTTTQHRQLHRQQ